MEADFVQEMEERINRLLRRRPLAISSSQELASLQGWDSVRFMQFILQMEKEWSTRFEAYEIVAVSTWGDLLALLFKKKPA